jgi:hypothetical protein
MNTIISLIVVFPLDSDAITPERNEIRANINNTIKKINAEEDIVIPEGQMLGINLKKVKMKV